MIELMGRNAVTRGPRWAVASLAFAVGLGFGALPFVQGAEGSAVAVRYGSQVPVGQQPFVELEAREPLAAVRLALTRDDGKIVRRLFPSLRKGQTARVALDGAPGTHRYTGELVASPRGGSPQTSLLDFETQVSEALKLDVDRGRLDLAAGRLWLTASRALAEVEVTVHGAAPGATARTQRHAITHSEAGVPLEVSFPGGDDVGRIDLKATDTQGFFTGVSLLPWAVRIPHEEVSFATDRADILPDQAPKLEASLRAIEEALVRARTLGAVTLFVAGHTDTVGDDAHNLKLSLARAQAIALYFRKKGLRLPIAFEGFGERALAVATPDGSDEARNRRVDYILALEPPPLGGRGFTPRWKALR